MKWYFRVWKKYAVIGGRARRREYWMFSLFHVFVLFVLAAIDGSLEGIFTDREFGLLSGLYMLAGLIPSIAVTVRRLHDVGYNGFWIFTSFIPFVGSLILLVLCVLDSEPHTNRFGPNPKDPIEHLAEVF